MEPFKNLINATTVSSAGQHLQRAWSDFDRPRFEALANHGLDALELKARMLQLADAMRATLPGDFNAACSVLEASLAPPLPLDARGEPEGLTSAQASTGLAGWVIWSMGEFVARHGQHDVPRSLVCLHALTQRSTAEFAIRPFIQQQPQAVWPVLARWANDPSAHVRRLVSEGSRPRLPWGLRLQALVADPTPALPLLRALQDDTSSYVRRSVANHLNDIAKDHPDLVADWVKDHLIQATPERSTLLRHASRSLIKQGHAPTLAAWGLASGLTGRATLSLSAAQAAVGDAIGLRVTLQSTARQPQPLEIDYAVQHVRANGSSSPKVFKGWKLSLAAGEERALDKRHSLKPVTTRTLYPGMHRIELLVNGLALAEATFDLKP
ncbi:HEAT repeat family protein [Hydrogenophaga sp. RAC07]|uniref:DNA alkylation repair protein n=1 Tax=Hydrogenophaga sp. RAC07 TaxID=1842537 RepID=UPI00083E4345|nr:DNA alkylation repair protein [Hydrogenophaga sp. RAC07]AOF86325.1 HEAT repeat family protein [Hydrogenophaga sp. RAC07]